LEDFITSWDGKDNMTCLEIFRNPDDISLVMMTTDTTLLPKGCPHTSRNFIPAIISLSLAMALDKEGRRPVCCQVPLHHISGVLMTLNYHLLGHKIVHPSATFDPKSTLQALVQEKCSDLSGTPEMYSAILTHPDFEKSKMSSVKVNVLAGTTILKNHCRMVEDEMGAGKVCVGFAEAEYGASFIQRPWDNYDQKNNNVGKILAGCKARICKLNSKEALPRGECGEIHIGGPFLIQEYLVHPSVSREEANKVFYEDDNGHWLPTGNEGVMDECGMLSIVGRFKDLIVRGGELTASSTDQL
jgi:acyl-CoA synthetase (AMP-forming)/AMP-acid ligase II